MEQFNSHNEKIGDNQVDAVTPPKPRTRMIDRAGLAGRALLMMVMRMTVSKVTAAMLPIMKCIFQPQTKPHDERRQAQCQIHMKPFRQADQTANHADHTNGFQ